MTGRSQWILTVFPQLLYRRCNVSSCKKKLGLTGFKCRCGHSYCGQHRYAESHECEFDYKALAKAKIADSNPLCQASKIQKF